MDVPDFRRKADRDRYRDDDWQQPRYNTARGVFGGKVPDAGEKAAGFSTTMKEMVLCAPIWRAYADWKKGRNEIVLAMRTNSGSAWGFMASIQGK
jgi:hypothetical protein